MKAYSKDYESLNRLLERVLDENKYNKLEDILWTEQDGGILKDIRLSLFDVNSELDLQ